MKNCPLSSTSSTSTSLLHSASIADTPLHHYSSFSPFHPQHRNSSPLTSPQFKHFHDNSETETQWRDEEEQPVWRRILNHIRMPPLFIPCVVLIVSLTLESSLRQSLSTHLYNYRVVLCAALTVASFIFAAVSAVWHREEIRASLCINPFTLRLSSLLFVSLLDTLHFSLLLLSISVLNPLSGLLIPHLTALFILLFTLFHNQSDISVSCITVCGWGLFVAGMIVYVFSSADIVSVLNSPVQPSHTELHLNGILLVVAVICAAASHVYKSTLLSCNPCHVRLFNLCISSLSVVIVLLLSPLLMNVQYWANQRMIEMNAAKQTPTIHAQTNPQQQFIDLTQLNQKIQAPPFPIPPQNPFPALQLPETTTTSHHSPLPSPRFTDQVTHVVITNFVFALRCVSQQSNQQVGDTCSKQGWLSIIAMLCWYVISQMLVVWSSSWCMQHQESIDEEQSLLDMPPSPNSNPTRLQIASLLSIPLSVLCFTWPVTASVIGLQAVLLNWVMVFSISCIVCGLGLQELAQYNATPDHHLHWSFYRTIEDDLAIGRVNVDNLVDSINQQTDLIERGKLLKLQQFNQQKHKRTCGRQTRK